MQGTRLQTTYVPAASDALTTEGFAASARTCRRFRNPHSAQRRFGSKKFSLGRFSPEMRACRDDDERRRTLETAAKNARSRIPLVTQVDDFGDLAERA